MAPRKYGSSTVTWSLPIRILLSSVAIIPFLLLASALMAIADREEGGAFLLAIGGTSMCLLPTYLMSIWRPRPAWRVQQRQERILESRLADSLAKESAPDPYPARLPPAHRRW